MLLLTTIHWVYRKFMEATVLTFCNLLLLLIFYYNNYYFF